MEIKLDTGTTGELFEKASNRGLVIIPDIMGIRPLFIEMAEDLSNKWDASVCVFDVFQGHEFPVVQYDEDLANHVAVVPKLKDSRLYQDTQAAAELIKSSTSASSIGLIGFCMGAMYTLKAMGYNAENHGLLNKGVAFYPQIEIPDVWKSEELAEPLEVISNESAPNTMAILGDIDPYTPPDLVEKLKATGVRCEIFQGCDHGFVHDPNRPVHKPAEAAQAWDKAVDFLYQ